MSGGFIDLLFPTACAGCGLPGDLLCRQCLESAPLIDQQMACSRCGAQRSTLSEVCRECSGRTFAFSSARCASLLAPPVSRAIVLLKDGGERRYAELLAALLASCAASWLAGGDVLVPVPASPDAVRRRGFDHSVDIARALGKKTGLPVRRLLVSTVSSDQRVLGKEERFENRSGVFHIRSHAICSGSMGLGRVVLVDDVLTTGATMHAAAETLRDAGVVNVRALAVARACNSQSLSTGKF